VKEMAEEFNRYFVSIITQLAERNDVDDLPIAIAVEHPGSVFEQFDRIHERDLRNMVNKAGTEEGITVEIMKLVIEVAGEKVSHIVNRVLIDCTGECSSRKVEGSDSYTYTKD